MNASSNNSTILKYTDDAPSVDGSLVFLSIVMPVLAVLFCVAMERDTRPDRTTTRLRPSKTIRINPVSVGKKETPETECFRPLEIKTL